MSSPFDPPRDVVELEQARASMFRWALVVGTWALCWAAVGTAIGVTRHWMGLMSSATLFAAAGLLVGGAMGMVAHRVERRGAASRPEVVGANGVSERPIHGGVLVIPLLAVGVPGLWWLAGLALLEMQRPWAAGAFAAGGLCAVWVAQRVWAQHRLARGLEQIQRGRGVDGLEQVAASRWVPGSVRDGARVNLAMVALQQGKGEAALRWLDGPWRGTAAAWAEVARALARLLCEQPEQAEEALREALRQPGRSGVDAEIDAVRVLLVWRLEGAVVAHELAEQLAGPGAGVLHRALLAALRLSRGDRKGADQLRGQPAVRALLASGLGRAINELDVLHK